MPSVWMATSSSCTPQHVNMHNPTRQSRRSGQTPLYNQRRPQPTVTNSLPRGAGVNSAPHQTRCGEGPRGHVSNPTAYWPCVNPPGGDCTAASDAIHDLVSAIASPATYIARCKAGIVGRAAASTPLRRTCTAREVRELTSVPPHMVEVTGCRGASSDTNVPTHARPIAP
ncbi:hypothetical protein EJ06DRAFT_353030 [Trichodelitschia bisporula]|uniref:Uncharacterized protein n=1 Tax=Trichodelitschia bisporula TaxID=703511 RepID=A0A6G1I0W9_9PEZI|nr:hypothetical protein EJ06DRAFT_353030 [Trichodelitschia bisporula]